MVAEQRSVIDLPAVAIIRLRLHCKYTPQSLAQAAAVDVLPHSFLKVRETTSGVFAKTA